MKKNWESLNYKVDCVCEDAEEDAGIFNASSINM